MSAPLNAAALAALLDAVLPPVDRRGVLIEEVDDQDVRLRFPFDAAYLGPGQRFSAPTLLCFAETSMFAAAQIVLGNGYMASVTNLTASFLKPAVAGDIVSLARVIARGRDVLHLEAWLFTHAPVDPIMHATATSTVGVGR